MLVSAFLAVDFAVVGSLIKAAAMDWYANLLVGVLTTGYLMTVYLVIDQPDEPVDNSTNSQLAEFDDGAQEILQLGVLHISAKR